MYTNKQTMIHALLKNETRQYNFYNRPAVTNRLHFESIIRSAREWDENPANLTYKKSKIKRLETYRNCIATATYISLTIKKYSNSNSS